MDDFLPFGVTVVTRKWSQSIEFWPLQPSIKSQAELICQSWCFISFYSIKWPIKLIRRINSWTYISVTKATQNEKPSLGKDLFEVSFELIVPAWYNWGVYDFHFAVRHQRTIKVAWLHFHSSVISLRIFNQVLWSLIGWNVLSWPL